ncbi:MAG: hypothetical protein EAZ85_06480 [Bacteroidetes bacterium]|nr:MAG: hypothetical protein EAZ85_06480 [Bacteroidota bacterium]TAG90477.1 MAG: hypothetical protein EAZ20_04160 [Bacteroidota bacterium]
MKHFCYLFFLIIWGNIFNSLAQTSQNFLPMSTENPLFLITDSLKNSVDFGRFITIHTAKNKPSLAKVMRDSINYPFQNNLNNELKLSTQNPNDGYWIHFKIENTFEYPIDLMLEFGNPLLKELEFFEIKEKIETHKQTGTRLPFASRILIHRNFVFPLYFKPKEQKIFYVYINNAGLSTSVPVKLLKPNFFWQLTYLNQTKLGAYMMFIVLMSVFIIFLFVQVKNILVGYLGLYILLLGLWILNKTGFAFQFFWGNMPILAQNAEILISFGITLSSLRLIFHFLEEYEYSNISLSFVRLPIYIFTFLFIFSLLSIYFENNWAYFILDYISFWSFILSQMGIALSFLIVLIRRETQQKLWLLVVLGLLFLPFIYFLLIFQKLETNFFKIDLFLYLSVYMILSLVIIIIHPIKYFRNEKKLEIFASIKKLLK